MHFLLLNQFFPPDPAPTGQLLCDVADALVSRGHAVTVICARATYEEFAGRRESPLVCVLRTPAARFRRGTAARLLSYATFYCGALWRALTAPRADVIVSMTTPPLLGLIGVLVRALRGSRHYIWEMDVYPDIAVALGVLREKSWLTRAIAALARAARLRSDAVIVLGPSMHGRLATQGIPADKLRIAENWVDGALIHPEPPPPDGPLVVLYSGNLGMAHDIDTILDAMTVLNGDPRFRFVFAGAGARRAELERLSASRALHNVEFRPYQDQDRLSAHLAACHLGLVTQANATLGAVVPSKVHGLMAAARPFLFIGPAAATPARILETWQCGWQIEPGRPESVVRLLEALANDRAALAQAGAQARRVFLDRYDRPAGVARILEIIGA